MQDPLNTSQTLLQISPGPTEEEQQTSLIPTDFLPLLKAELLENGAYGVF